jgi:pimeloyl-ACP methyl ester carboxylesterase
MTARHSEISGTPGTAQLLALEHPGRVATLTLLSTSPVQAEHLDLPPMSEELRATFSDDAPLTDWSDRVAAIDALVEGERAYAGSIGLGEERVRGIAARVVDRTVDIESSMTNHFVMDDDEPVRSGLDQVTIPTLVLHGTDDPFLPYGHAEALASEIPGARLVPLEGAGHQYPPPEVWHIAIPAILEHTSRG